VIGRHCVDERTCVELARVPAREGPALETARRRSKTISHSTVIRLVIAKSIHCLLAHRWIWRIRHCLAGIGARRHAKRWTSATGVYFAKITRSRRKADTYRSRTERGTSVRCRRRCARPSMRLATSSRRRFRCRRCPLPSRVATSLAWPRLALAKSVFVCCWFCFLKHTPFCSEFAFLLCFIQTAAFLLPLMTLIGRYPPIGMLRAHEGPYAVILVNSRAVPKRRHSINCAVTTTMSVGADARVGVANRSRGSQAGGAHASQDRFDCRRPVDRRPESCLEQGLRDRHRHARSSCRLLRFVCLCYIFVYFRLTIYCFCLYRKSIFGFESVQLRCVGRS
jgi:hypothetical protein